MAFDPSTATLFEVEPQEKRFDPSSATLFEEPQEEVPKEATIGGEAVKSFKQMGSAYQTAYETLAGDPEAAVRAGMKRREQFIKEYGQTRGLEEFLKVYGEDGMLAAGAEFASQVPTALAGQTATLGSMAAMGKLGAGAGAAIGTAILPGVGTAAGATIGGAAGAILSQIAPFYQENLEAQLRAQEERGEPVDLNRAKAAAYAAMQSSAEVGGTVLAFGKRLVGKIIGSKPAEEAREALVKAASQSLAGAVTKGGARAVATELPVELAQNILTRDQAGKSLTSDEAFEDYKNTIFETLKVAGPLGAGAGPVNRAAARGELARRDLAETYAQEQLDRDLVGDTTGKVAPGTPEEAADLEARIAEIEGLSTDITEPPAPPAPPTAPEAVTPPGTPPVTPAAPATAVQPTPAAPEAVTPTATPPVPETPATDYTKIDQTKAAFDLYQQAMGEYNEAVELQNRNPSDPEIARRVQVALNKAEEAGQALDAILKSRSSEQGKATPAPAAPAAPEVTTPEVAPVADTWRDSFGYIHYKVNAPMPNGKATITEVIDQEQGGNIGLRFTDSTGNPNRQLTVGFSPDGTPYWFMGDAPESAIRKAIGDQLFDAIAGVRVTNTNEYAVLLDKIRTAVGGLERKSEEAPKPTKTEAAATTVPPAAPEVTTPAVPKVTLTETAIPTQLIQLAEIRLQEAEAALTAATTPEEKATAKKERNVARQELKKLQAQAPAAPEATPVQGDQNAPARPDSTGVGVGTEVSGQLGGVPPTATGRVDRAGVDLAGDISQPPQDRVTQQPDTLTSLAVEPVVPRETDQEAMARGIREDIAQEEALDTALEETRKQKLPSTKLPDIEGFQEEYDLAREDLAKQGVKIPKWDNLEADEKDYFVSVLPTNPSGFDYTDSLRKLAEYKETTGRGAGYGQEKVTPTQRRIINGYEEQRPGLRQQFGADFPAWGDLTPEAQKAYTDAVTSNAPIQQYAGFKAVQDTLAKQGISIFKDDRGQLKRNEAAAQQRAQTEQEQRAATEAEAVGKGKPLSENARAALAEGDINGVLDILSSESQGVKTPETKRTTEAFLTSLADSYGKISAGVFRFLARSLSQVQFNSSVVTDVNDPVIQRLQAEGKLAEYDPKTDTFYFTQQGMDEATVLHEIVHAATVKLINQYLTDPDSLSPQQREALDHLQKIYDFSKTRLGTKYKNAYENMYEFVSYALTDPRFQRELANIQSRSLSKYTSMEDLGMAVRNLWGEITRSLANLYGLLTGRGKKLTVHPDLIQAFSEGMSPEARDAMFGDPTKALMAMEKGFEGNLLLEVTEIFNQILTTPEAGIEMSPLAAKVSGAAAKQAGGAGKPISIYDSDPRYKLDGFKPESLAMRTAKASTPDNLIRMFQNTKHDIKKVEDKASLSGLIKYSGKDKNDAYTEATLAPERGRMSYNEYILPFRNRLEATLNQLVKATNSTVDKTIEMLGKIAVAQHEPERRTVKFLKTAPLRPPMADVRRKIFEVLESPTLLSDAQVARLRKKLDSIVFELDQNGNVKIGPNEYPVVNKNNVTPLGFSPSDFKTTDIGHADYTVVDMDSASVQNIMNEYRNHPQKALIDNLFASLRGVEAGTRELNKVSNYWSNPVTNITKFYGWQNYVPMKARIEKDGLFDPGHRGRELQDRQYSFEGMDRTPDNPILQAMSDAARAASRAGRGDYTLTIKNAVNQGLIPGKVTKTIQFADRDQDLPEAKKPNTIFHYNANGTVDVIEISDPKMLNALRRTYKDSNPLVDAMNMTTGFIGKMHTRWNYAFAPMNFVRDALTNAFVLGADFGPLDSIRMINQIASQVGARGGLFKAAKVAAMYENGDIKGMEAYAKTSAFAKQIVDYLREGGAVSYTAGLSLKDQLQQLNRELGRGKIVKTHEQFEKFVDVWNNMFEFSSRAAAYGVVKQRLMKQGMSEADARVRATAYVKNLANFEQTGEHGKLMGGLFMFFRPAATGAVRAIESVVPAFQSMKSAVDRLPPAIKNNPAALAEYQRNYSIKQRNARIMVASLLGLGAMTYMMAASMADEDDLGRNTVHADNMNQWNRYARFHIPNAISESLGLGKDVVFQMPWGFGLGAFAAAGAQLAAAATGRATLGEAMKNIFTDITLDSFIPLPVSKMEFTDNPLNFLIDSIAPSMARPLLQFVLNKDGLGRGIYNEPYRRMADAFSAGDRVPEIYKDAARYMFNEVGIDVNPNSLYFLSNSFLDGVGRVFETTYGALGLAGEQPRNIKQESLIFGSFFGNKGNVDNKEFARIQAKLTEKQANLNAVKNDPIAYAKYIERNPMDEVLVKMYLKDINGELKKLQAEAKYIRMAPKEMFSPAERKEILEPNLLMQRIIKANLVEKYKAYEVMP